MFGVLILKSFLHYISLLNVKSVALYIFLKQWKFIAFGYIQALSPTLIFLGSHLSSEKCDNIQMVISKAVKIGSTKNGMSISGENNERIG